MGNLIVNTLLCILIPILMLCGLLDKKARIPCIALMLGCCMCLAAYYLNTYLYPRLGCTYFYLITTISPMVEELLKFLPILVFSCVCSHEKEQIVPFAFATGIGFAIIENSYMLLQSADTATTVWIITRGIGTGLMHGMSTAMLGVGIYMARQDRRLIFVGTLSALFLAIMYHGAYNCMIQTDSIKFLGILLPIFTYIAVFLSYNKIDLKKIFVNE